MPKSAGPVTFETVRTLGLELPGTEEGTAYGSPALKVNGRMFACMAIHRSAEPGTLVLQVPFDQRNELLAEDRDTYYLTDHYAEHPTVLVRLSRVHRDALRDLLRMAHRFVTGTHPTRRTRRHRGRR
ncbi:MAG: MmcQ/YjbR family DNA-binding protein [Betaproteobacteria bacterium]